MNLKLFNRKYRFSDTRKRISETMKHTGQLWKRYLELKPDGYEFNNCKQFRSYLKHVKDAHLINLLEGAEQ